MGDDGGKTYSPPNFITECFFLAHIMISLMNQKLEQEYRKNNDEINDAIDKKDIDAFEEAMAYKLCLDVHIFGKATQALYRSLFSFTHALIMCTGTKFQMKPDSF